MKPVFYGLIILGALIIYEAWMGLKNQPVASASNQPSNTTTTTSTGIGTGTGSSTADNTLATSTQGPTDYVSPESWAQLIVGSGIPLNVLPNLIQVLGRESNYYADATCWAPLADASKCTPYQKAGDTQAAMGGFQFLGSTWDGYQCAGSPYNPADAVACVAKVVQSHGCSSAWGFNC